MTVCSLEHSLGNAQGLQKETSKDADHDNRGGGRAGKRDHVAA